MNDWVKDKVDELKRIEDLARVALESEKDKPYFDNMLDAYVSGYIQSRVDDCVTALNLIKKDLEKTCGCEECEKLH